MNLIKLCVGVSSVDDLVALRAARAEQGGRANIHRTRMMPKKAEAIVGQGSLYWVMARAIRCRQAIVGIERAHDHEGKPCCDIVLDPEIIRVAPQPRRPFQGWRYLEPEQAPRDLGQEGEEAPPDGLAEELARYGLI